jgi:hypothetical protein
MNFFKNNILFFALLFIPGLVFTALLVLSYIFSSERADSLGNIDRTHNDISSFKSEMLPFKGLDYDLQLASEDLDSFASVERQQNRLWDMVLAPENNLSLKWSDKSPDKVNSMLTLQYTRLRKLCREKNIVLPGNRTTGTALPFQAQPDDSSNEFGFGMTAYDGNWPNFSKDEAQKLGIQIEIIKELVGYVSKAAISQHPIELVHLRRESVGSTDEKNIAQDQLDLAGRDDSLLRSSLSLTSMSFELCLIGHTPHARTFLNSLSPPYFLRDLIVVREDAGGSTGFSSGTGIDFAPANPVADDSELPIVQDVRSKFTFLIEYVTSVNRNPDEFFRRVVRKENYNEEMLGEFLVKSGHKKLIKSLIEFLKSEDDA